MLNGLHFMVNQSNCCITNDQLNHVINLSGFSKNSNRPWHASLLFQQCVVLDFVVVEKA